MKTTKLPTPSESHEQQTLMSWWTLACPKGYDPRLLMACPAQAARSPRNGARMKAEGYRAGTPDLFLAIPRGTRGGLFVEMKRRDGGTLSESQREMLFNLSQQGYATGVACGWEAAKNMITEYLQ